MTRVALLAVSRAPVLTQLAPNFSLAPFRAA
nr:MAG TPA: hypothetical protein [Bacteriophage sp.]